MSTFDGRPPAEERPAPAHASTGPTVTTAPPPRTGGRWSRLPTHVGPARTSTIVLALLFAGIFVLWLYVHPRSPATTASTGTSSGTGQVQQPAPTRMATPTPTGTTTPTTPHSSTTSPPQTTTSGRTTTTTPSATTGAPGATSGQTTSIPSLPTSGSAPTS